MYMLDEALISLRLPLRTRILIRCCLILLVTCHRTTRRLGLRACVRTSLLVVMLHGLIRNGERDGTLGAATSRHSQSILVFTTNVLWALAGVRGVVRGATPDVSRFPLQLWVRCLRVSAVLASLNCHCSFSQPRRPLPRPLSPCQCMRQPDKAGRRCVCVCAGSRARRIRQGMREPRVRSRLTKVTHVKAARRQNVSFSFGVRYIYALTCT